MPRDNNVDAVFAFFNEVAIIEQLSRSLLDARLPDGLIAPHFAVINHLTRLGDGRTPLSIARAFQVPKTTMTHTLSVLEKHGLIQTGPNPEDARSKLVFLTDAGRAFREDAIARMGPDFAKIAAAIPSDEIAAALPFLRRMREFLDENRAT